MNGVRVVICRRLHVAHALVLLALATLGGCYEVGGPPCFAGPQIAYFADDGSHPAVGAHTLTLTILDSDGVVSECNIAIERGGQSSEACDRRVLSGGVMHVDRRAGTDALAESLAVELDSPEWSGQADFPQLEYHESDGCPIASVRLYLHRK